MKKSRIPGWLAVVGIVLIGVLGFSGYKVASIFSQYKEADDEYEDLQALMNRTAAPAEEAVESALPTPEGAQEQAVNATVTAAPTAAASPTVKAAVTPASAPTATAAPSAMDVPTEKAAIATAADSTATVAPTAVPESEEQVAAVTPTAKAAVTAAVARTEAGASETPEPLIQKDFAPLLEINDDAVGWIYSENTAIDYPIVQGDDNVFYLDHLFSRSYGFAGAIFMDIDNAPDFSDWHTVVYGHHLNNGSMFASLSSYRAQTYYEEHPVMYLHTPTGDYRIELFSGYARDASTMPHDFDTTEEFLTYVDQITRLSNFTSDVVVGPEDRIISLVTCSYVTDDARFVVHGKLVQLYAEDTGDAD